MSIGNRIRLLRHEKQVTQRQLAQLAALRPDHLCRIETGYIKNIQAKTANKISLALGVSIEYLLCGELEVLS